MNGMLAGKVLETARLAFGETRRKWLAALFLLPALLSAGCSDAPWPVADFEVDSQGPQVETETPCDNRNPLRNLYWGDTHVHTGISLDAYLYGVRNMPDDAYRYGFGGPLQLPPYDNDGNAAREVRIDRPLDFVAVTDHAEFLGEAWMCIVEKVPGAAGAIIDNPDYNSDYCKKLRGSDSLSLYLARHIFSPWGFRNSKACGKDGERCRELAPNFWQQTIAAAERWDDKSSHCERTAFIAYEYSSFRMGSNLHRNVIFKNNVVPRLPISHIEEPLEWNLWRRLKELCKDSGTGCDAIAIPHNSNISNGRMFNVDYYGAADRQEQAARAELRMEIEPIIEVMQHKGDSECRNGIIGIPGTEDELCDFEKFEHMPIIGIWEKDPTQDGCPTGFWGEWTPHPGPNCYSPLSYARYALVEGLAEEQRIGVNPFKFGLSAATDTHNGMAGGVQERNYAGHLGDADDSAAKRSSYKSENRGNSANGPGGIIGVWAEENNRGAIFDAMRRKEVYGTSGPRIRARLFGGWNYSGDLCSPSLYDEERLQTLYQQGVPMGGDLPPKSSAAPGFVAIAAADPGTAEFPGTPLQRLQIIKGWVDGEGQRRNAVIDVAGDPNNGAGVDTSTCRQSGEGFAQLCTVWQDPDFDASRRAVYYLRAVENPSCRYDAWQCMTLEGDERPADCDVDTVMQPKSQQERAWSSPIWYTPEAQ